MREKYITGIVKKPSEDSVFTGHIENTLEGLQNLVEGLIQKVAFEDCVVICNEEGLVFGLSPNCKFRGYDFFGTIVVVGADYDEFVSLRAMDAVPLAIELNEGSYE